MQIKRIELCKYQHKGLDTCADVVAVEAPLEIQILHSEQRLQQAISVTMRTPGNDAALAIGFLRTEGILTDASEIVAYRQISDSCILVELHPKVVVQMEQLNRNFYTTSSCGVCGKASIDAIRVPISQRKGSEIFSVEMQMLCSFPSKLREKQAAFELTGGLHGCAIFDATGVCSDLQEDVGRHNALDKLIGNSLIHTQTVLYDKVLVLSGRASFELVQKAAVAGMQIVAAIGAPSSLAVELAEEKGITLVGFLKEDACNIYSFPERIVV